MYRKHLLSGKSVVVLAALAVSASGATFADDNSMSIWTGESYAFFNDLDYSPGHFNVARAPRNEEPNAMAKSSAKEQLQRLVLRIGVSSRGTATYPFRDHGE